MNMQVTDAAIACLKNEWGFRSGEFVRVYIRYMSGGADALALGIQKEKPRRSIYSHAAGGMTFYVEESDEWYMKDRNVTINAEGVEITFTADLI